MKNVFFVVTLTGIIFFVSCSKKNSAGKTPKFIPTTYSINVAPLIQAKCSPCHLPTKGGRKANFETYDGAKKYGAEMLERVQLNATDRGFMPLKHEKLPTAEILIFKKWLEQGLREN